MSTLKNFGWQLAKKTINNSGKVIVGTVNFTGSLIKAVYNKDADVAIDIIGKRVQRSVKSVQSITIEGGRLFRDAGRNYLEGKDIMDEVNQERILNLTSIAATAVLMG